MKEALKKIKEFAGEVTAQQFKGLAQLVSIPTGEQWVQFDGNRFVDGEGNQVNCSVGDIKDVEWLASGETLKDFVNRKKNITKKTEAENLKAENTDGKSMTQENKTHAPLSPASVVLTTPAMVPIAELGLSPELTAKLIGLGYTEFPVGGDVDFLMKEFPAADLVKIQNAISKGPLQGGSQEKKGT